MQGGFSRPEFTPDLDSGLPRVGAHIAELEGSSAEVVAREEEIRQERRAANRRRRQRQFAAALAALAVMLLIVAGVVGFWEQDPYAVIPGTV